jgi:hypothetical protein
VVLPVLLDLDAPPIGLALVSLLLPVLPELEPVPVAPIELVLLEPGVDEVSLEAVPLDEPVVPLPLRPAVPLPDGLDLAVLPVVPLEPVVVPLRLQADSERAAVTVRTAAVTWVRVIFIGKLLKSDSSISRKAQGQPRLP